MFCRPNLRLSLLIFLIASTATYAFVQPGFDQLYLDSVLGITRAWGIGIADFNSDAIPDILAANTYGDVHLFPGNGDGTFQAPVLAINHPYHNAYSLAIGDFNGDTFNDFVLTCTANHPPATPFVMEDGHVMLYLGNGNGTFQSTYIEYVDVGLLVGDAGTDVMTVAAADVDGDLDIDIVAGDITTSANNTADVTLFRNIGNDANDHPTWAPENIIAAPNLEPDPDLPPYWPPVDYLQAYGLAFGDLDGDDDQDLLVGDRASYLYIYQNDGTGHFTPLRYDTFATRPYAYDRLHETFTNHMPLATGDLNGDGLIDFAAAGTDGAWNGMVDLWLNTGNDTAGRPQFLYVGIVGGAGTESRGLAIGQLDPLNDNYLDILFGNYQGDLYALFADLADSDGDGIIDTYDNAPLHPNAPRLDMNTDGGINYLDQLDNDHDNIGDPNDDDDDNDNVPDAEDNAPFNYNPDQSDADGDGRGDVSDPLNNTDTDADGVFDGPLDPTLYAHAKNAKATWSQSDTHFIIRIDALGRAFQNEFTQTLTDGAILTPQEWELKKFENYNGIGDAPADPDYQVPVDLPGGKNTPITLVVIPKQIWNAFGDPDPIRWINDRNSNPNLEIGQHGTYHANNTLLGDWADDPTRNYFSCETCGLSLEESFQLLRIGLRTLLGDYADDPWIQDSGAMPGTSPTIDWADAANPLISYAPPFNASDTISRDATARLFYAGFSASVYEENSSVFTPEGSHHETFDDFGMFHASADRQVDPEFSPPNKSYDEYLDSITQYGQLNTWLIEEVEWSTRYCNNLDRLANCPSAPGDINRENNMVDPDRWNLWMTLLDFVNANGQPMTLGDYALAMAFDNAPTVPNPDQADADHDGIGDVVDNAAIIAQNVSFESTEGTATGYLAATLTNDATPLPDQLVTFTFDADGNGQPETYYAITEPNGHAAVSVTSTLWVATVAPYTAAWDGLLITASDDATVTITGTCPLPDLTGDCHITLADLAILAAEWLLSGDPQNCNLAADINGDCSADFADFAILAAYWLK